MTGMPLPEDPGMPPPAATGTAGNGTARKPLTPGPQTPARPLPNRARRDTLAGPAQGQAGPGRTVTATAEDPSA